MTDIYIISKIFLIGFIWILIVLSLLFILNSKKIYNKLKSYEELSINKRKEFIYNHLPLLIDLSKKNKALKVALNINKISLEDFLHLVKSALFNVFPVLQGLNLSFKIIRKTLR